MLSTKPEPRSDAPTSSSDRRSERWFWPAVIAVIALGSVSAALVSRVPPSGLTTAMSAPVRLDGLEWHPLGFAVLLDHPGQGNRLL